MQKLVFFYEFKSLPCLRVVHRDNNITERVKPQNELIDNLA